jgi:hypothetical protein
MGMFWKCRRDVISCWIYSRQNCGSWLSTLLQCCYQKQTVWIAALHTIIINLNNMMQTLISPCTPLRLRLWKFKGPIWTRSCSGVLIVVTYGPGIEFALRCDPGEVFMRDCNICICSVDGIADHASCTIHQCRRSKRGMIDILKWYRSGKNMLLNKSEVSNSLITETWILNTYTYVIRIQVEVLSGSWHCVVLW